MRWHKLPYALSAGITLILGILALGGWYKVPVSDGSSLSAAVSIRNLSGQRQGRNDTLHVGIVFSGNFLPLPPALLPDSPEAWIMSQVYGPGLVLPVTRRNGEESPEVALAASVTRGVRTGTTFFTLKEGIKFHDGDPLTLYTIKATLDKYSRHAEGGDPAIDPAFAYIESVEIERAQNRLRIDMPDWMNVQPYRIATVAPLAPFVGEFSRLGIEEELIGLGGYEYQLFAEPAGEGGARRGVIHLRAFEEYFEGSPQIKNVSVHLYPSDRELIQALITGDVHVARLPTYRTAIELTQLIKGGPLEPNHLVKMYPRPDHFYFLAFNNARYPFNITRVRQALARAINREEMRDEPSSLGIITDLPVHPKSELGRRGATAYAPQAARRMLDEAGLLTLNLPLDRTGQPIRLELIYPDHVALYEEMALRIKNDLQRLGFRVDAEPVPPGVVRVRLREGDYSMALSEMTLPPTAEALYRLFHSSNAASGLNFSRYSSSTFNSSINGYLRQTVPNPQFYLDSAVRLLSDDLPLLPLFFQANEYYVFNIRVVDHESAGRVLSRLEPIARWKWQR